MFMLKSLFGKIWGDQNNLELIQIPAGALYLVRPGNVKSSRECIYKDAVVAIRRTATERNYQLVVTRAYEEGEEQLLEEDDESDDERSFLIDEALEFQLTKDGDEKVLTWRDLNGDEDDFLEFVIDSQQVNEVTASIFEVTFLQCVYERKTGRSHEEASDEDLERLRQRSAAGPSENKVGVDDTEGPLAKKLEKLGVSSGAEAETEAPEDDAYEEDEGSSAVLTSVADLYLYDQASGLFMVQEKVAKASVIEAGRFLYWLSIRGAERRWLSQKVEAAMNMNFSPENLSAVWNYFDDERRCFSWLLRFADKPAYDEFHKGFTRYLWETLHEESWAKAKADDQQYMQVAYEQKEDPMDVDEDDEETDEFGSATDESQQSRDRRDDDEDQEDEEEVARALRGRDASEEAGWPEQEGSALSGGARDVNSQLAVGYKFDRSFVVRGNQIGVFKHTDDNRLEFDTTINKIATPKGKAFRPNKIMLHNQDAAMVMMDPGNKHALYNLDLEYGKVVEEWKVHDDVTVNNVVPNNKFAQMTAEKTMIGHSHNGIYRIDPRLAGNKLVDAQFKQYASKNDFSTAATDSKGRLAVASNKGDIRLFDSIGKNAKTALPALGDPIVGVDVTADGRYIIATCKTYLLLIDTLIGSGRYQGHLGFERSFPADAKPVPKRLTLKPSHVAYMGSEVSFTPARFDTGSDTETSIVTSTGNYVVSWSFSQVKKGNTASYVLKRYSGEIIQDEHTYGSDQAIVVAFENDVQLANRSQLLKPTRKSLAPGRR
ncbi:Vacuolar import and degradation protein 27 [Thecaphora frezii]